MLFMSYLRKFCYQRSQRISPRNLYNFRFHIFVYVKFQVNFFIWWREVLASIFCIWMFQHLLLTMFYLVKLLCHLCWDHLIVYTWASFYTILIYISILTPNTTLSWILQLNKYWNQTEWGLSCFSKIILLIIPGPLNFQTKFRICLSISTQKAAWILIEIAQIL